MGNIEIVKSDVQLSDLENLNFHESTNSGSLSEIEKSRSNPFLKFAFSGAVLIGSNSVDAASVNFLSQSIIEQPIDVEQFLNNYKSEIEQTNNQSDLAFHNRALTKQDIVRTILSFKALQDNWDGHNACPPEIDCASNALLLVDLLGDSIRNIKEIYPNPNGTITFEWNNDLDEVLNVEIGIETMSYYVEIAGKETVYADQKLISSEEVKEIIEYISIL